MGWKMQSVWLKTLFFACHELFSTLLPPPVICQASLASSSHPGLSDLMPRFDICQSLLLWAREVHTFINPALNIWLIFMGKGATSEPGKKKKHTKQKIPLQLLWHSYSVACKVICGKINDKPKPTGCWSWSWKWKLLHRTWKQSIFTCYNPECICNYIIHI